MTTSRAHPGSLQPGDSGGSIVVIGPDRRTQAIARLLAAGGMSDLDHAQRFLNYARDNEVSLDHLWAWEDELGRFRSVVLAVPGAGRSAMVFASQSSGQAEQRCTADVLEFGMPRLGRHGVQLAQALLDPHENSAIKAYLLGGFHRLATLSYLERPLHPRRLPPPPQWPEDVAVQPYEQSMRRVMIEALDASYEQTLDCPGLRGIRSTDDIFDGHRASGRFDPHLWTLLRVRNRPAGVLLLNPSGDKSSIELVYLGLAKSARGRGLGAQLLRHGLHLVANRSEHAMTLAVDDDNVPALSLYKREQFRPVLRREALIRSLRASPLEA